MSLSYSIYKEGGLLNDRYQKIEDISEGSYGYVSLANDVKEKRLVAVKYIFKLDEDDDGEKDDDDDSDCPSVCDSSIEKRQQLVNNRNSRISSKIRSKFYENVCLEAVYEVDIQLKIGQHKNIVSLLDYFDSYIILEYCSGGDLYEAIKDDIVPRKTVSIVKIFNQIMDAVEFVHSKSIYHRDIKPENILISGIDWNIKLTDWGLATTEKTSLDRNVGSERYMAPELFESNLDLQERKEPYDCSKVDIWAMGIVFLNIVFQKNPFSVANQTDKSFCYFAGNREALFDVFSTMSYDFFQVLRYSLTIDPLNRNLLSMRNELNGLSEFTMDDEYYNNLGSDNYTAVSDSGDYMKYSDVSSSTTAVNDKFLLNDTKAFDKQIPFSLPNPIPAMTLSTSVDAEPILINNARTGSPTVSTVSSNSENSNQNNTSTAYSTNNTSRELSREKYQNKDGKVNHENSKARAKSVPKFRFNKRSHPKPETTNQGNTQHGLNHTKQTNRRKSFNDVGFRFNNNYGNKNHNNTNNINNYNKFPRAIKIQRRKKKPIIKNSRKPLGLPTPNSHMNNFFNEYKSKDNFNTSDFFTPPTLHNRYIEGIFNNNNRSHDYNKFQHGKLHNNSNKLSYNYHNNSVSSSKNQRRPSTTGSITGSEAINYIRNRGHSRNNSSNNPHVSPGRYIPPNLRITSLYSGENSTPKNISEVLDIPPPSTYHEQFLSNTNGSNNNGEPDLDDVLFTLEENDYDFVKDMDSLSLNNNVNSQSGTNLVPDLLKTNHVSTSIQQPAARSYNGVLRNSTTGGDNNSQDSRRRSSSHKYKAGVYVPPHHRRLSAEPSYDETLSVPPNGIAVTNTNNPYYNQRRPSLTPSPRSNASQWTNSVLQRSDRTSDNISSSLDQRFMAKSGRASPFPLINHASSTTAVQNRDVFAEDNDALVFEDDDDELDENGMVDKRAMFGPYEIYDQNVTEPSTNKQKDRTARKSSLLQDQAVNSLEEYKNNWLMLQQQD
ncbi:hypothetical protein TPHA_0H01500 [Tetrapisispora phaffii CBS 4417]|uniref:non-specific serine/threonine protein kinase n=1 Tax=Tetrapisispora phaffii (strain ATCC 24235 / CBS 4417 / NBRC 1672 / NRRL Y-8282 / UCD 70-5) TaxID=1071381 RepID=G8BX52_TETPH|nr:hypothetical protein TPHA_0H01500 [Tetrapisispora phaffii CBS 4417]CCE64356.1 hypothetical protein TPHA_0H01500 [Tetrapisispora phaffii CBS 4417]